jgi:hypothetical protein
MIELHAIRFTEEGLRTVKKYVRLKSFRFKVSTSLLLAFAVICLLHIISEFRAGIIMTEMVDQGMPIDEARNRAPWKCAF